MPLQRLDKVAYILLENGLRWRKISVFMKLRISQTAAAIPLIGYAILWSEKFEDVMKLQSGLGDGIWFSVTGRLRFLYFSAITLTIAWLIFLWKCPEIVRRWSSMHDYVRDKLASHDAMEFQALNRRIEANQPSRLLMHPFQRWLVDEGLLHVLSKKSAPESIPAAHRVHYTYFEYASPFAMTTCTAFCALGLSLAAIPSFEVFLLVVKRMIF